MINVFKILQDNLGDFQDYQVQGEAMHSFGIEMADEDEVTPATLLAMGALADSLLHQQQQTRGGGNLTTDSKLFASRKPPNVSKTVRRYRTLSRRRPVTEMELVNRPH